MYFTPSFKGFKILHYVWTNVSKLTMEFPSNSCFEAVLTYMFIYETIKHRRSMEKSDRSVSLSPRYAVYLFDENRHKKVDLRHPFVDQIRC